jgi:2-polyprenyl-3-methyl-5-hydroxy-6-metoxy-1,4-benzoquinol methylase
MQFKTPEPVVDRGIWFRLWEPGWHTSVPLEYVHCNLCGADDALPISKDGPLELVRCRVCDLVYVSTRLTEEYTRSLYNEYYFRAQDDYLQGTRGYVSGYRDYTGDQAYYLRTFQNRMRWIERYANHGNRLLDVGCAAGFFLLVAQEKGWQVQGVEPAEYVSDYASNQLGLDVFCGTLQEAAIHPEIFDVVTLWDVLEHTSNPRETLTQVNYVLKPGGLLVLSTQNIESWVPKLLGVRWLHYGHHIHIYHFSPKTITHLLKDTGYQVLKVTKATAGKYCSMRFLVDKLKTINRPLFRLFDSLLSFQPGLEKRAIYINPGDEMVICARKTD